MKTNQWSTKVILALLVLAGVVGTTLPYVWARFNTGETWRGVTPEMSYDAMYYFARANDVTRGHAIVTNPYFLEHRSDPIPNPTLDDPIVALPQILGISFNTAYYVNIFLWTLAFFGLFYRFFREHALSVGTSLLGLLWCYIGIYGDMLRPGAMQVIYPLYALFLLFFWRYLNKKSGSILPLALIIGLTAYFYIFLFMVIAATLGTYALLVMSKRNWDEFRRVCTTGIVAFVILTPYLLYAHHLSTLNYYGETMERINLLSSHWPQIEAYYYGRWVLLVILLSALLRRYYPERVRGATHLFVFITGIGILIAMVSNVFTGKDFGIATHVGRFGILWYLTVAVLFAESIYEFLFRSRAAWTKRAVIGVLSLLLVYQMVANLNRDILFHFGTLKEKSIEVQTYAGVLEWLGGAPEGVVVAPNDLNSYIPTLTKQYVLYNLHGGLFAISNDEFRERFLLSHAFDKLTPDDFINDSSHYGPAPSELAKTSALKRRLCVIIRKDTDCPPAKSTQEFLDIPALQKKFYSYYPMLATNITQEYKKYHVRYIISKVGDTKMVGKLPFCTPVYQDQWFLVCEVAQ